MRRNTLTFIKVWVIFLTLGGCGSKPRLFHSHSTIETRVIGLKWESVCVREREGWKAATKEDDFSRVTRSRHIGPGQLIKAHKSTDVWMQYKPGHFTLQGGVHILYYCTCKSIVENKHKRVHSHSIMYTQRYRDKVDRYDRGRARYTQTSVHRVHIGTWRYRGDLGPMESSIKLSLSLFKAYDADRES